MFYRIEIIGWNLKKIRDIPTTFVAINSTNFKERHNNNNNNNNNIKWLQC